ncbi:MAG: hypothetical protein IIC72_12755, partial [Acidobacteria bacterium]|nr:hypothetical protein [Acidobacteriota bacterium]
PHLIGINIPGFTGDFSMLFVEESGDGWNLLWRLRRSQLLCDNVVIGLD